MGRQIEHFFRQRHLGDILEDLRKDRAGRWEIVDDIGRVCVLSSGATCEVQIGGQWATRIEFGHGSHPAGGTLANVAGSGSYDGYYHAVQLIILLCEGLPARVTDRRDWYF